MSCVAHSNQMPLYWSKALFREVTKLDAFGTVLTPKASLLNSWPDGIYLSKHLMILIMWVCGWSGTVAKLECSVYCFSECPTTGTVFHTQSEPASIRQTYLTFPSKYHLKQATQ